MGDRSAQGWLQASRTARLALPVLAFVVLWAFAGQASAATLFHSRTPALDVEGLNHACGVAVDSKGDLYTSSAGAAKVLVFGPANHETPIGEIANANEPCGLAVTSTGVLYVSERKTGFVVRYKPAKYPFEGAPSYGPREVIDASGLARGISVDPFDDRLYVAEGTRVSAYDSLGNLGVNETQEVRCFLCTGGKYKLEFEGATTTKPIPFEGPAEEVKVALEEVATIGAGNVSVINGSNAKAHLVTFEGKLAHTDVPALKCIPEGIEGGGSQECKITELTKGWSGHLGEGDLTQATGVAAYTYKATGSSFTYHLALADAASDQLKLFSARSFTAQKLRRTLDGPQEGEEFGFGAQGAYLGSDRGTCPPAASKACTAGHFYLYDDANEVLDEFEADGELLSQTPFAFGDGAPTAIATDRSGGAGNGALYATTGAGPGARALAFGPLGAPSRPGPLAEKEQSLTLPKTCSVAIDSFGNRYLAVGPEIVVYPPTGSKPLAKIAEESGTRCRIAVDSEGNVYALLKEKVGYFKPSSFPPKEGTTYGAAVSVAKQSEFGGSIEALAINPANGHLLAISPTKVIEYDSAKEGSKPLNAEIGAGLGISSAREGIATCAKTGNFYISAGGSVYVLDKAGKEILTQISGAGSPAGSLGNAAGAIAVDQSNCHVIVFETHHENVQEYESSGTYLASFGSASPLVTTAYGVAVDNGASSPNKGDVFLAFDDTAPGTFDLTAFGPLEYPGSTPTATTTAADGFAPGKATLHGTVNPNGSPLEDCRFEYLTQADYETNGKTFAGAEAVQCAESLKEIGEGSAAVPVHADIEGLSTGTTYLFRLVAENEEGAGEGEALPFALNPPAVKAKAPLPLTFTEATLRGEVDPAGAPTTYFFQYLSEADFKAEGFGGPATHTTPAGELPAGEGFLSVKAQIGGLAEGTEYRFRLVASNGVGEAQAEGPVFQTLEAISKPCPNAALRTGPSAALPDCRAYERVSPVQDSGWVPFWGAGSFIDGNFATTTASPSGESIVFETEGPLPGTEGNGVRNGYRARRGPGGWGLSLYGPTYAQTDFPGAGGVSADHGYSFWAAEGKSGSLDPSEGENYAHYLSLPAPGADPACSPEPAGRFELIGCGSQGTDPEALGRWISPGASHVIFTSGEQLESDAPEGKLTVYDRSPGGATHVLSLLPDGSTPSEPAAYRGVSADGSAVAFSLGEALYVRLEDAQTLEVGAGATFAGLARDGSALFYLKGGALHRYDTEAEESTQIAAGGDFVNVAAEGARAYFTSTEALAPGAEAGEDNLYLWEAQGEVTRFVALLDAADLEGAVNLSQWVEGLDPGAGGVLSGPAIDPSRSTPDGEVLIFQSHADLSGYEAEGNSEVFRYDAAGAGSLACISCGPEGTTASSEAQLQYEGEDSAVVSALAPIANLSVDGKTAFFTSAEALLPADQNTVPDVYEWREGTLSLISTGQSRQPSALYAVSASGNDVFFSTHQALVAGDEEEGSRSIYDARVEGGFAASGEGGGCEGEGCIGAPTAPPQLNPPLQTASLPEEPPTKPNPHHCPKGKHKVKRHGKVSCVKPHKKKKQHNKHNRQRGSAR